MARIRIRHHVNPLKAGYFSGVGGEALPLPEGHEVEAELGCADARFLFERAAAHPTVLCLGVEIRQELVEDVNARAREVGLQNLSAHFANLTTDLEHLFLDGRLARAFVNFPDPWFKRRHHKRRLLTPRLAATIAAKLAPGGELLFQSDVWDLALDAMAVLEDSPLTNALSPWSFWRGPNPYGARSLREEKCEQRGWPVWRMVYRRRDQRSAWYSAGSDTSKR